MKPSIPSIYNPIRIMPGGRSGLVQDEGLEAHNKLKPVTCRVFVRSGVDGTKMSSFMASLATPPKNVTKGEPSIGGFVGNPCHDCRAPRMDPKR